MRRSSSMLFVEDDSLLAEYAVDALRIAGLHVHPVADARAAIELFVDGRFDCAVIDVELPGGIDGVELARRLRELRPGFPIVLATGYDADACGAPADLRVFQKPYRFEDIVAVFRDGP
ncbi:response regulator [Lysobacter arvi]|uniref:Response regulator n=1 Tax=Lysobacter arvi TaxID=3038776 RepID=A0ABU1CA57_9GAMM|nr:response regulator [Lysobacter arvi]MDR0182083.1 response regulator [Lysobacter arvi]